MDFEWKTTVNKIESRELWKVHNRHWKRMRKKNFKHTKRQWMRDELKIVLVVYWERDREPSRCRRSRRSRSRCFARVLNVLLFARRAMLVPNVWVFVQRNYDEKFMNKGKKEQPAKPSSNSSSSTINSVSRTSHSLSTTQPTHNVDNSTSAHRAVQTNGIHFQISIYRKKPSIDWYIYI